MKNSIVWIPPAQTTLRRLAELNRRASYLIDRSESIQSKRSGRENLFFKKLVEYQSELSLIRNRVVHEWSQPIVFGPEQVTTWKNANDYLLLERYNHVERLIAEGIERLAVGKSVNLSEEFEPPRNIFTCDAGDFSFEAPSEDAAFEDAESVVLAAVRARIKEHLHEIQREAGLCLFKLRVGLNIDRRAKLRSIVQVLFKNMDDYDSENYVLRAA